MKISSSILRMGQRAVTALTSNLDYAKGDSSQKLLLPSFVASYPIKPTYSTQSIFEVKQENVILTSLPKLFSEPVRTSSLPQPASAVKQETAVISPVISSAELSRIPIGAVSKTGGNFLFVPGSISDARETGEAFVQKMAEKGIDMAWINSNMSITQYPAQIWGAKAEVERNHAVEEGIKSFIRDSGSEKVTLVAHSAGSLQAIQAIIDLREAGECSHKEINLVLCGAGGVSHDLEASFKKLQEMPGITIHEYRSQLDPVPFMSGTGTRQLTALEDHDAKVQLTIIPTPHTDKAKEISENATADHLDEDRRYNIVPLFSIAQRYLESHFLENYYDVVADDILKHQGQERAGKKEQEVKQVSMISKDKDFKEEVRDIIGELGKAFKKSNSDSQSSQLLNIGPITSSSRKMPSR